MLYQEFAPAPDLRNIVASYWNFSIDSSEAVTPMMHTVPPDGAVSLCWLPMGRAVVVGPRTSALRVPVQAGHRYCGVRFLPGCAGPLLGVDVPAIREVMTWFDRDDLSRCMRTTGLAGLDELIRVWCTRADWHGPDAVVAELTHRIIASDGSAPVTDLIAGLNLSYRQILRRFYDAAGLTPKEFARIRRMRAACLATLNETAPAWAEVSASAGFADQSHLVREFQDMFGWPPRLVHEYLRRIEHRDVR
jgi:AraC-like DNA-binding protein